MKASMRPYDFVIPVPVRPKYTPGSGPPVAPLTLQPEDEETGWMIWSVIQYGGLPQYQICLKDNHAHRRVVQKQNILEYVSQKVYEDFEYEEAKRKDDESWKRKNKLLERAQMPQQSRAKSTQLIERAAIDKAYAKRTKLLNREEIGQRGKIFNMVGQAYHAERNPDPENLGELSLIATMDTWKRKQKRRPAADSDNDEDDSDEKSERKRQKLVSAYQKSSGDQPSLFEPSLSQPSIPPLFINSGPASRDYDEEKKVIEEGMFGNAVDEDMDDVLGVDEDRDGSKEQDNLNEIAQKWGPGDNDEASSNTKVSLKRSNSSIRADPLLKIARVSYAQESNYQAIGRVETYVPPPPRLSARFPSKVTPQTARSADTYPVPKLRTVIPHPKRIVPRTSPRSSTFDTNHVIGKSSTNSLPSVFSRHGVKTVESSPHANSKTNEHSSNTNVQLKASELARRRSFATEFPDGTVASNKGATHQKPLVPGENSAGTNGGFINSAQSSTATRKEAQLSVSEEEDRAKRNHRRRRYRSMSSDEGDAIEHDTDTGWEIRGLLNDEIRYDHNGVLGRYYLVDWEGEWTPSWEPECNLSKDSLAVYRKGTGGLQFDGIFDDKPRFERKPAHTVMNQRWQSATSTLSDRLNSMSVTKKGIEEN